MSLAEASAQAGRPEEGLDHLRDALTMVERTEERVHESEIHRLRGVLLLEQGAEANDVEASFHRALEVARRQAAKSLELRSAVSLARLWQGQGRREEARRLLSDVNGWFPEGANLPDLKQATELLERVR